MLPEMSDTSSDFFYSCHFCKMEIDGLADFERHLNSAHFSEDTNDTVRDYVRADDSKVMEETECKEKADTSDSLVEKKRRNEKQVRWMSITHAKVEIKN